MGKVERRNISYDSPRLLLGERNLRKLVVKLAVAGTVNPIEWSSDRAGSSPVRERLVVAGTGNPTGWRSEEVGFLSARERLAVVGTI
jgi:hypothetical protein